MEIRFDGVEDDFADIPRLEREGHEARRPAVYLGEKNRRVWAGGSGAAKRPVDVNRIRRFVGETRVGLLVAEIALETRLRDMADGLRVVGRCFTDCLAKDHFGSRHVVEVSSVPDQRVH